jgi:hypothetical protein
MNRTLIQVVVVVLFLWLITACHPQKIPAYSSEDIGLKGPVKKITVIYPNITECTDSGSLTLYFNENEKPHRYMVSYDSSGMRKVDRTLFNVEHTFDYVFNRRGSPVKIYEYVPEGLVSISFIDYNIFGNLTSCFVYSDDFKLFSGQVYKYDSKDRILERIFISHKGEITSRIYITYEDENRVTSFLYKYKEDIVNDYVIRYKGDCGEYTKIEYFNQDSVLYEYRINEFDENCRLIKETIKEEDSPQVIYHYVYDEYDNWIQKKQIGYLMPVVVRRIEYYR